MAKAFYTHEEAQEALQTDDDGIKGLVDDGRLTEYRDGPNLMYKGSQIEKLQGEGAGGLSAADSGGPIGLADSSTDSVGAGDSMGISLDDSTSSDVSVGESMGGLGLADSSTDSAAGSSSSGQSRVPGSSGAPLMAGDETGEFAVIDTGVGMDAMGGTAAGASQSGITIFEDDEVDPSAQTDIGGSGDQVALEGIGSGSGLLDLTQEPDDTSFGAETFDEIMPESSVAGGTVAGTEEVGIDTSAAPIGTRPVGTTYEVADPTAPIFGGLAGGAAAAVLIGLMALTLSVLGADPGPLAFLTTPEGINLGTTMGVLVGLPIIGLIVGFVGGKMASNA